MMNKKKIFIAILIFWLILVGGLIVSKEMTLRSGKTVMLKTMPVDPRDLFRGDYVVLNYEISRIDLDKVPHDVAVYNSGSYVYVQLEERNGTAYAAEVSRNKPNKGIFMRGQVKNSSSRLLSLEYGIESYFVPEGKGRDIERKIRTDNVEVEVAINEAGGAIVKNLYIDGNKVEF